MDVGERPGLDAVFHDGDPGIDDALALLMLVALDARGAIVLGGVSTVAGNAPVEVTAQNAAFVLDRAGRADVPVHAGEPRTPPPEVRVDAHGVDALGGVYQHGNRPISPVGAAEAIRRHAAAAGRSVLVAAGPLTNLTCALSEEPTIARRLTRTVVAGSSLGDEPDFNWSFDPDAADRVCRSDLVLDVVPLGVSGQVTFESSFRLGGLAGDLLAARLSLGRPWAADAVAAALLCAPHLAAWEPASLRVERSGRCIAGEPIDGGHCRVATGIDAVATRRLVLGLLGGASG